MQHPHRINDITRRIQKHTCCGCVAGGVHVFMCACVEFISANQISTRLLCIPKAARNCGFIFAIAQVQIVGYDVHSISRTFIARAHLIWLHCFFDDEKNAGAENSKTHNTHTHTHLCCDMLRILNSQMEARLWVDWGLLFVCFNVAIAQGSALLNIWKTMFLLFI